MKHCIITPTQFINDAEIGGKSDFLLVLSHLLDADCRNKYAEEVIKFRESGKEIYLDNGLFENHVPESGESLLKKAELIGASVVFAPDYLYQARKTEAEFELFANLRDVLGVDVKLAFVVQADNPLDYLNSYKWAEENTRVDLIGMSILSIPKSFAGVSGSNDITLNRIICMRILRDFIQPKKDVHLLGLGDGLGDIVEGKNHDYIKSNDSSSAFQNGLFGKGFTTDTGLKYPVIEGGKIQDKVNFDLSRMKAIYLKNKKLIERNIDFILEISN